MKEIKVGRTRVLGDDDDVDDLENVKGLNLEDDLDD